MVAASVAVMPAFPWLPGAIKKPDKRFNPYKVQNKGRKNIGWKLIKKVSLKKILIVQRFCCKPK
jgi:hypothetical protein